MFNTILVVCVGNICRSPMAAALLSEALSGKGEDARRVESAGIGALVGAPADPKATALMAGRGLSLAGHKGRQLDEDLLRSHDLVLVMERGHQEWIESRWREARGRVYRWGHWSNFEVPDPYKKDESAFREALALIERGLAEWKEKL